MASQNGPMVTCPNCRKEQYGGRFCTHCGTDIKEIEQREARQTPHLVVTTSWNCKCGIPLLNHYKHAKFCPSCGQRLSWEIPTGYHANPYHSH